jgi:hypothetical protein
MATHLGNWVSRDYAKKAVVAQVHVGEGDPLAVLERLAKLHEQGVLTPEEFATKKAEILGRI